MSAQQGRGSQVSAVTKSGTNEFHGNLFEFVRNDLFNARNYFATKGSTLKRNQFGGTVGGPIIRNKLFFFGGYQGTTLRQDPSDMRAVRSNGRDAGGRLYGLCLPGLQCQRADHAESALCEQPHRSGIVQSGGGETRRPPSEDG